MRTEQEELSAHVALPGWGVGGCGVALTVRLREPTVRGGDALLFPPSPTRVHHKERSKDSPTMFSFLSSLSSNGHPHRSVPHPTSHGTSSWPLVTAFR